MEETKDGGSIRKAYKSWGEKQIARLLDRNGIAYQYEYPVAMVDRGKPRLCYPDFRLPEYGFIIGYFGVNSDSHYDHKRRHKLEVYEKAGIDGLFLTRDSWRGDWPAKILGQIEDLLRNRVDRFYHRNGIAIYTGAREYVQFTRGKNLKVVAPDIMPSLQSVKKNL